MNAHNSWWIQKKDFKPIGTSPSQKKKQFKTPRKHWMMRRPFAWVSFWRRQDEKPLFVSTTILEKTSLLIFENLSLNNDLYIYNSQSSDSDHDVSPSALVESFPYWEDSKKAYKEATQKKSRGLSRRKERGNRLRHTLLRLLKNTRQRSTLSTYDHNPSVTEDDIEGDSQHFSISTDTRQPTFHRVNITITTNEDQPQYILSSDSSSEYTTRSTLSTREDRISLGKFMEDHKQEYSSLTGPMNLGNISASDSASVGSVLLGVSFDEDYPQLVLQPSHDRSASGMASTTVHSNRTLGASYPHPFATSKCSVSSSDSAKNNASCTPRWLKDNIDRVWNQVDQGRADLDDRDDNFDREDNESYPDEDNPGDPHEGTAAPDTYEGIAGGPQEDTDCDASDANDGDCSEGTMGDDTYADTIVGATHEGTFEGFVREDNEEEEPPLQPRKRPRYLSQDALDWVDDVICSLSADVSQSIIEKEVIHPILKPLCQLVEATEIPSARLCSSRRPMATLNTSIYRMSPRKVTKRFVKKV